MARLVGDLLLLRDLVCGRRTGRRQSGTAGRVSRIDGQIITNILFLAIVSAFFTYTRQNLFRVE